MLVKGVQVLNGDVHVQGDDVTVSGHLYSLTLHGVPHTTGSERSDAAWRGL